MDPLPISILLISDCESSETLVGRAISDVAGTTLTVASPHDASHPAFSTRLTEFNIICVEDRLPAVDALAFLEQLQVRGRHLWVIVVIPTLADATRVRELFRAGAADVLLPEEVGPATLQRDRPRRELREKESLLGGLLRSIPQVAIAAFDDRAELEIISAGAMHIFGRTPEDLLGVAFQQLFEQLQEDTGTEHLLERARVSPIAFSFIATRADNSRLPCKAMVGPRYDANRALNGLVAVCVDQQDEKALQERLIEHERLSTIGELVAGVAHDLNNPLAGIAGFCELLQSQQFPREKAEQFLAIIAAQTERCRHIVENLLTFARPGRDSDATVEINTLLEAILELRSYHLIKHRIKVERVLRGGLPKFMGNCHQLQQAFYNVVLNAEQALRDLPRERLIVVTTDTENGSISVVVSDNGPGVPSRLRPRIFDSFFTSKAVGEGTGLGLSLARKALRDHDGDLVVEDGIDGGAAFRATLRLSAGKTGADPAQTAQPAMAGSGPLQELRSVLVVDDEPTMLAFYGDYFRQSGAVVLTARTLGDALSLLRSGTPDLVIADVRLSDGSGLELVSRFTGHPGAPPILLCTGIFPDQALLDAAHGESVKILQKPFTLADFTQVLGQLCAKTI